MPADDLRRLTEISCGGKNMTNEKEIFLAFESVRTSGVTNMFNRVLVCELADITKDEYMFVLKHYNELAEKYLDE